MNSSDARLSQDSDGIDLRWVATVVQRRIILIAICLLIALVATFAFVSWKAPVYAATATLLVEPVQDANNNEYNLLVAGEQLAITYAQMLKSGPVLDTVRTELGIEETSDELAERLTVVAVQNTQLVRLTARAPTPEDAQRYANTAASVFTNYIQSLHTARYQAPLASLEQQINTLSSTIDDTQTRQNSLTRQKIDQDAELARLETQLSDDRIDYRGLQDSYQTLQMQVDQLSGSVYVVQPASSPQGDPQAYQSAEVILLVGQAPNAQNANYSSTFASQNILQTYQQMLIAQPVLDAALAQLDMSESASWLASFTRVEPISGTQLIRLTVSDMPGATAARLANAIAGEFIDQNQAMLAEPFSHRLTGMQAQLDDLSAQIDQTQLDIKSLTEAKVQSEIELAQLETRLTEDRANHLTLQQDFEGLRVAAAGSASIVVITESATAPASPTQTKAPYLLLGAVAGLIFGMGLAFLLEQSNDKIRSQQDIHHTLGVKPIGSVSMLSAPDPELVVNAFPSIQAEEFRLLSTSIRLTSLDNPLRTLLVTSPTAAEGKSLVAANLAATYARAGTRVVLVDADLHFPRIHQIFSLRPEEGLTDLLLDGDIETHLKATSIEGLRVLTSGEVPNDVVDIFSSPRLKVLIDEIAKGVDLVVIDSPPVLAVADTSILAAMMDGALLVLRAGKSGREAARDAVERLRITKTNLLGVVLNGTPTQPTGYYRYSKPARRKFRIDLHRWRNAIKGTPFTRGQ